MSLLAGKTCCSSCASGHASCAAPEPKPLLTAFTPSAIAALRQRIGLGDSSGSVPNAVTTKTTTELAPGMQGILQILPAMEAAVRKAVQDPSVRRAAVIWVKKAPAGNRYAEAHELWKHITRYVQFRRDPSETQFIQEPAVLLGQVARREVAAGNCATHSVLWASLGHVIRLPIVWVLAGRTPSTPEHIYAAMRLDGRELNDPVSSEDDLLALDSGEPASQAPAFGKHANAPSRRVVPALRGL